MKTIILFALFVAFGLMRGYSQADTTIKYFEKNGKETTKDSAVSYAKFFKQANMWHGMEYYAKRGVLKSEGDYSEPNLETAIATVNNYKENGELDYTTEYVDGKLLDKTYYYKSGNKKSWMSYTDKGVQLTKGWDETGKEIKNYVVRRDAQFKGGDEAWKKYLEKNLNLNIPTAVGAPPGKYEVQIQFVVDKEGIPTNLKAVSVPAKCKACGAEVLRIFRESPKWEPAILNNEPVIDEAVQTITFNPVEGIKKG